MSFDSLLYRPLKDGKQFDKLLPKTTCKSTSLGKGMTDFSIKKMADWVNQYAWQTEKIAKLFQKSSLSQMVTAIHEFVYNHFQYKADQSDQLLRSPACSWYDRHNGIDCKSYSIFASSILTNLGIKHYLRRIKQPGFEPADYTHVYVVIPKDQNTGNLTKGHYVIDGTLQHNIEPVYTEKSDIQMLAHYGLNGTSENQERSLFESFSNLQNSSLGKQFSINNITNLISSLGCIGGTAYDKSKLDANAVKMHAWFNTRINNINAALAQKNYAVFAKEAHDLIGRSKIFVGAFERKKAEKSWNSCTNRNFDATIRIAKFYRDSVAAALQIYITQYFDVTGFPKTVTYTSHQIEELEGIWGMSLSNPFTAQETVNNYVIAPETTQLPKFEITPYVAEKLTANTPLDPLMLLQGLTTVVASFTPQPTTPGASTPTGNTPNFTAPTGTTNAGFGMLGWLFVLGGLGYAFTKMKDKNTAAK